MYQITIKKLLLTAFGVVSICPMFAQNETWRGNWQSDVTVSAGNEFYLYDSNEKKFVGNTQSGNDYYPSLKDTFSKADLFQFTSIKGSGWFGNFDTNTGILNTVLNKYIYVTNNSYTSPYATSTNDGYDIDGNSAPYGFYYNQNIASTKYYLKPAGDIVDNQVGHAKNAYNYWYLISGSQYKYRPLLEDLITTATAYANTLSGENKTSLESAVSTAISALSGTAIEGAYTTMLNSYNSAINSAFASSADSLQSYISQAEAVARTLAASMGKESSILNNAISTAETTLSQANAAVTSAAAESPVNSDAINEQKNKVSNALNALLTTITVFSNPNVRYAGEMKALATKLGYSFPDDDTNALLQAVEGGNTSSIHSAIETAQTHFKTWVTNQVNANTGFPKNTNMTGFILNNSFETGDTYKWTASDNATHAATKDSTFITGTNGVTTKKVSYSLTGNSLTYSQDLTGLPYGSYSLSAGKGTVSPTTFEIKEGHTSQVITVKGDVIDSIKLTLDGGAASIYNFSESTGVPSSVLVGTYSTVNVTRPFKASTNWNTFCSPCDIGTETANSLFSQILEMTGVTKDDDGNIALQYSTCTTGIIAGKAYLVKAKSASSTDGITYTENDVPVILNPVSSNYSTDATNVKVQMLGTFCRYAQNGIPNFTGETATFDGVSGTITTYVLQSNNFCYLAAGKSPSLSAFRAYFNLWIGGVGQAPSLRLAIDEAEEKTGIANINVKTTADQVFDLNGRQVSTMNSGLYVKGGKKVFIQK